MQRIHSDDDSIESQIQAKALTAPRITPAEINASIASEHYFRASDGIIGLGTQMLEANPAMTDTGLSIPAPLALLTFCVLVLKNGFTVTGESACASPENFDPQIGRNVARQNAINKIWPLLGYQLKDDLHRRMQCGADTSGLPG